MTIQRGMSPRSSFFFVSNGGVSSDFQSSSSVCFVRILESQTKRNRNGFAKLLRVKVPLYSESSNDLILFFLLFTYLFKRKPMEWLLQTQQGMQQLCKVGILEDCIQISIIPHKNSSQFQNNKYSSIIKKISNNKTLNPKSKLFVRGEG